MTCYHHEHVTQCYCYGFVSFVLYMNVDGILFILLERHLYNRRTTHLNLWEIYHIVFKYGQDMYQTVYDSGYEVY